MFLHIGNDCTVFLKDIIGIFDFENTTTSKITREFLSTAQDEEFVINVSEEDLPKSFVVAETKGESRVYISPISPATLNKRIKEESMNLEGNIWTPKE